MGLKFWAYYSTHSKAILTDAAESIVNIVAAAFALYSVYLSDLPKDKNHLYGHGKIEFFSSGLEGLLIILAGIGTFIPAIFQLINGGENIQNINLGIAINIVVIIINAAVGYLLIYSGKKQDSLILEADGKHLLIDSISSCITLIALLIVLFTKNPVFDPIIAICLAIYIAYSGYKIFRKSISGLMDETDLELLSQLKLILNKNRKNEWIDVHHFKIMRYGTDIHIDCHLTLPFYISLENAHDEVVEFEKTISSEYGKNIEFFIHSDPCLPQCCNYCEMKDCQKRSHAFEKRIEWDTKRLISNHKHFND